MTEHRLETVAIVWDAIASGAKTFEIRRNDRFYQQGDIVVLSKVDDNGYYVAKAGSRWETVDLRFRIGWMLQGGQYGIEPGYCVFSLEKIDPSP